MEATQSRNAERTVVELLVTWGAAADPVVADLLRALAERRGMDDAAQLRAILRHAEAIPDEEVGRELRSLLDEAARGDAADPSFRERYRGALERLETVMAAHLAEARESFRARLEPWLTSLDAERRDDLLVPLWRSGRIEPPLGSFSALEALSAAETALESARREMIDATLRQAESAGDAELLEQLREAAAADDPARIADGRRRLGRLLARSDAADRAARAGEARERLLAACGAARETLAGPGAGADPVLRDLLNRAVESGEAAAAGEDEATPPEALERWRETLETFVAAIGEGPPSLESRAGLARRLAAEVERLPGDAGEAREAARDLDAAVERGGAPYHEALQRCCALLEQARDARDLENREAEERLRESAGRLRSVLGRAAAELPTARVVQARLTLEQVEEAIASGDPSEMEGLAGSLREQTGEIEETAAKLRKVRHSRTEAGRARVREEAERLIDLAPPAARRKLEGLAQAASDAEDGELGGLGTKARALNRAVERAVRRDAVLLVKSAAGREKRGKLAPGARKMLDELRGALERDALDRVSDLTVELAGEVGRPSRLRGPLAWGLGAAGLLLLVAAALVGWRFLGDRPQPYVLMLDGGPSMPAEVTVTLYQDGRPVDERPYDAEEGVTFRLRPGRYEVMVNDRYTGRVLRVPADPSPVEGIPVPPAAGGN